MTLVDTSVWIDHFRTANPRLEEILEEQSALTHPYVIGELACGGLRKRSTILEDMRCLPGAVPAEDSEVFELIERRKLWGKGLGWIDCHLLASALCSRCRLWTLDKALARAAAALGVGA